MLTRWLSSSLSLCDRKHSSRVGATTGVKTDLVVGGTGSAGAAYPKAITSDERRATGYNARAHRLSLVASHNGNALMPFYDISVGIAPHDTPVYPGDPGIEIIAHAALARGDAANVSLLRFGAHTATHVDAPAHFIADAPPVASLSLDVLIGPAQVVELGDDVLAITAEHITAHVPPGTTRVLFKTRNSAFWAAAPPAAFRTDFTYLKPDAAHALVAQGAQLVGIDYLSIEQFKSEDFATHIALLERGVVIVEGLDLRAVPAGRYELICLPLKLTGGSGDGAPARAVLRAID